MSERDWNIEKRALIERIATLEKESEEHASERLFLIKYIIRLEEKLVTDVVPELYHGACIRYTYEGVIRLSTLREVIHQNDNNVRLSFYFELATTLPEDIHDVKQLGIITIGTSVSFMYKGQHAEGVLKEIKKKHQSCWINTLCIVSHKKLSVNTESESDKSP